MQLPVASVRLKLNTLNNDCKQDEKLGAGYSWYGFLVGAWRMYMAQRVLLLQSTSSSVRQVAAVIRLNMRRSFANFEAVC